MRIYLANVGANMSEHKFASPVFGDGKFEFLPIPADDMRLDDCPGAMRYSDLRSHYDPGQDLHAYVPPRLLNEYVLRSPEFETFTYCDVIGNPRASNLKQVQPGDVMLFLAGLRRWTGSNSDKPYGMHLVGGFQIEEVLPGVVARPNDKAIDRFAKNTVVELGVHTGAWGGEWLFAGSKDGSRRFNKAVPLNREICEQAFTAANRAPWRWGRQSETATVASYTRTARRFLDTSNPEEAKRATVLRDWIAQYTGEADAALLGGGA